MNLVSEAYASETATATPMAPAPSAQQMMIDNLLILGLLFFIFYFILIRPQQKRLKTHQAMLKALEKGNRVMTSGGLIGTIAKFEGDDVVVLEIAQGVKVRVARSSVTDVVSATGGESANDN
jgi:preprotein translocase subunit YajC